MADREQRLAIVVVARDLASKSLKNVSKELGGLDKAGRYSAGRAARGIGSAFHNIETAGLALGGVAVAGGAAVIKMAMDYETSATGIRKTVNGNVDGILADLRKMATEVPVDVNSLNAIGEAAGALGVAKGDIVGFTRTVALLGVTTDLTTEAAATSLGHLKTTLKLTGNDFHELGDELVYLGNNGASTESEIMNMAENIAGAASTVGASKEQVLGWASAMASAGEEAEAGGSSIQRFWLGSFKAVNKGGASLDLMAKISGRTAAKFKKDFGKDATGTLSDFIVHLGKLSKAEQVATLDKLGFKDIRIQRALLKLLGNTDNLTSSLDDANHAAGAMGKEAEQRFKTTASQVQLLKNNVQDAGITIGTELLPVVNELAKDATGWLHDHPGEIKEFAHDLGQGVRDAVVWAKKLDWNAIGSALHTGADAAKTLVDAFLHAPPWLQQFLIGGFVANKFTGGAIGDIGGAVLKGAIGTAAGGLGSLFSRGSSAATPMYVKDVSGGIGKGGAAGGAAGGGLGKAGFGLSVAADALAVIGVQQMVSAGNSELAGAIHDQTKDFLAGQPDKTALLNSLAAVDRGIADIQSNPLNVLVQGDALDQLKQMRSEIAGKLATQSLPTLGEHANDHVVDSVNKLGASITSGFERHSASEHNALAALPDPIGAAAARHNSPYVARQLAKAQAIVASNHSTRAKINELKAVEHALDGHNRAALAAVRAKIGQLRNALRVRIALRVTVRGGTLYDASGHPVNDNGPGRATGGPVTAGKIYRVNEQGSKRELFQPKTSGEMFANTRRFDGAAMREQMKVQLELTVPVTVNLSTREQASKDGRYRRIVTGK
jgi:TP901 family phage tail tape measure protein